MGYSPWGHKESERLRDFTFAFHFHALEKEMATHSSVYGVAQSRTQLTRLSSSSSNTMKPSLVAQMAKNLPAMQETQVQSLSQEYPLKKGMATHSSIIACRIPWTEEPGGVHGVTKTQT